MKLLVFATYRQIVNAKSVDIPIPNEGTTVKELLQGLIHQFPAFEIELFAQDDKNRLKPFIHLFVNGRNIIHLDGLATPVKDTDEIALIPPVGGG